MGFIEGIKDKFANYFLNKELTRERNVMVSNLKTAHRLAVLYRIKDEKEYNQVKKYLHYMRDKEGITEVMALGYVDTKEKNMPDFLRSSIFSDFFTKDACNWHLKPSSTVIKTFVNEEYDILIDMTTDHCLPLKYVLARSRAKFKVGRFNDLNKNYYDLMINVPKQTSLPEYLKVVNHYLTIINTK